MQSSRPVMGMGTFARRILGYLKPYRRPGFLLLLTMLVNQAYLTIFPLSLKFIIDDAIVPKDLRYLVIILVGLAVGAILSSAASLVRDFLYARLGTSVLNDFRVKLFSHLQRLSMDFYARTRVGDVMARFSTDLLSLENVLVLGLPVATISLLNVLVSLIVLFTLEWHLALLTMIGLPLCFIGPRVIGPRASAAALNLKEELANVANTVQENVNAQPVVKAFGLQRASLASFNDQILTLFGIGRRANFLSYLLERTPNVSLLLFTLVVIGSGAFLTFYGYLTVGDLVAFNGLFISLSQSVYGVTSAFPYMTQAAAGLQRIEELLNEEPKVSDVPDAAILPRPTKAIEFENVTFGYTPGQRNLDNVSLEIPYGATVAFVGPSGSGKSTVLNLIIRFYDPTEGKVVFDGHDLRQVTHDSLLSHLGVVFQESFLFNITIRENIRLGRPEATEQEIEKAAKVAEIHDFIESLPQGYDTPAGERGGRFSGGQRQRIAIARALLRDPAILVLDEATSALDPATESAINETLKHVSKERTVVSVTHRLGPVVDADCIFVLRAGQVVESGSHEKLLRLEGTYAELWNKQSGFTLSKEGDRAEVQPSRLRSIPLLSTLEDDLLAELASEFVTERFVPERAVVEEGDPGDKFYIIVRGEVVVTRKDESGEEQTLAVLQDGDYFGEIALLKDVPRTATVRAKAESVFLSLSRTSFSNLLERAPHVREALEKEYMARIRSHGSKAAAGEKIDGA
jgi:ATP-binding cassette subfamily B protein